MKRRKSWESFCDWCSWHEGIVFTVVIIVLSIGITAGFIKYQSRFYYTNEPMIIEVTDKQHWTTTTMIHSGKVMIPKTNHHYSISSDEYEISVDSHVYNSTEIGDRVVVDCICKYLKEDDSLVKIMYEYAGN